MGERLLASLLARRPEPTRRLEQARLQLHVRGSYLPEVHRVQRRAQPLVEADAHHDAHHATIAHYALASAPWRKCRQAPLGFAVGAARSRRVVVGVPRAVPRAEPPGALGAELAELALDGAVLEHPASWSTAAAAARTSNGAEAGA